MLIWLLGWSGAWLRSPLQHMNPELQGPQDPSPPQQNPAPESADWETGQQGEQCARYLAALEGTR